jgi:carboxymethylenebutenolidase
VSERMSGKRAIVAAVAALFVCCGTTPRDDYADRMAAEHAGDRPVAAAAEGAGTEGDLVTGDVSYGTLDGAPVVGYLARPADKATELPGVIVIHEWWGLNDNIRSMTRELAAHGYAALAVDLYRTEPASDPDRARELMTAAMEREGDIEANLRQAYDYLATEIRAPRIGVIGWCFGGGWSLRTALMLPDEIDAAVIYYGRLVTDRDRLAKLKMPILGIFGGADQGIPVDSVRKFESVLTELGKDAEIHVYDGAGHAFANPSGTRYVRDAAEDAWAKTLAFLDRHLRAP